MLSRVQLSTSAPECDDSAEAWRTHTRSNVTAICRTCGMLRSTARPMQTGSGVVLRFRRPKRNATFKNDSRIKSCIERYDNGTHCRLQFLQAISHRLGSHTEAFQVTSEDDSDRDADASNHEPVVNSTPPAMATSTVTAVAASSDMCEVCLIEPRDRVALVPCGHSRFCSSCADAVVSMPNRWPTCRTPLASVLRVYI